MKTATEDSHFAPRRQTSPNGAPRFVVTGPLDLCRDYVRANARLGIDIVFMFDEIASVVGYQGQPVPTDHAARVCWPLMKSVLVMRDALVTWLAATPLYTSRVFLVVAMADAHQVAQQLGAELVVL